MCFQKENTTINQYQGSLFLAGQYKHEQQIDYQSQELPLTSESSLRVCDLLILFPRFLMKSCL